jgi:hypothetical protein
VLTRRQRSAGPSILIASWLALTIAGCGDGGHRRSGTPREGVVGDLPCAFSAFDTWTFDVTAGQRVEIAVDTLNAASAADYAFFGFCEGQSFQGRDERACSFPPPFGCPATSFTATSTTRCSVSVFFQNNVPSCRDATTAEYVFDVRVDDVSASLTLVDEFPPSPLPRPALTDSEDVTPCGAGVLDSWRFDVLAGESVAAAVHTADQQTAADLALNVACGGDAFPFFFHIQCDVPPPSRFGCPLVTFDATADATCILTVGDFGGCADPSTARYRLGVERDGVSAALALTNDDLGPATSLAFTDSEDLTPCGGGALDLWQFDVLAGETVMIAADTADQETAANLSVNAAACRRRSSTTASRRRLPQGPARAPGEAPPGEVGQISVLLACR